MSAAAPLASRAARAAVWAAGLRLGQRGAGFVRLFVLTHLLAPEHFGAMGIALLSVELLCAFSQTGLQTALVRRAERPGAALLDTAWSLGLLRGIVLFGALAALAPQAAAFFGAPEAAALVRAVGVSLLLQALANVGVAELERDLDFRRVAAIQLPASAADLAVAVGAALLLGNAWAFAAGLLAGDAVRAVASHAVCPHRPRLRLARRHVRELLGFGKWMLLSGALLFAAQQGDDVGVGRLLGAAALGLYQFAWQLSHFAVLEGARVASQIALPSYARLQHDAPALRRAWLRVAQGSALLAWPLSALLFVFAEDLARVALPERWHGVGPVARVLALHAALRAQGATIGPVFLALGRPQLLTATTAVKCCVLAVALVPLVRADGVRGAACAALLGALAANAAAHGVLLRALACPLRDLGSALAVPFAATLGMAAFLGALGRLAPVTGAPVLALHAALGVAAFAAGSACLGRVGAHPLSTWTRTAVAAFARPGAPPAAGDER